MGQRVRTAGTVGKDLDIPDKLYFRIGEVSKLAGVKPYVLRFWETEFPLIAPKKSGTGHRLYRRKDVEIVLEIKDLLHVQRYTIEGARQYLETSAGSGKLRARSGVPETQGILFPPPPPTLDDVRRELISILHLL